MIPVFILITTYLCGCTEFHSIEPKSDSLAEAYRLGCQQLFSSSLDSAGTLPRATTKCYRTPAKRRGSNGFTVNVFFVTNAESEAEKMRQEGNQATDARFRDPHLSAHGVSQAMNLNEAMTRGSIQIGSDEDAKLLRGEIVADRKLVFATSNLRRSALTLLVAFRHFFSNPKQSPTIHILSALQEKSESSIDNLTLSGPREIPYLTYTGSPLLENQDSKNNPQCPYTYSDVAAIMDPKCNDGDENGRSEDTILNLCTWLRNQVTVDPHISDVVLVGDGQTVKNLFQAFHPRITQTLNRDEIGEFFAFNKQTKINHGSMLKFRMTLSQPLRDSVQADCAIIPTSASLVAGNFLNN